MGFGVKPAPWKKPAQPRQHSCQSTDYRHQQPVGAARARRGGAGAANNMQFDSSTIAAESPHHEASGTPRNRASLRIRSIATKRRLRLAFLEKSLRSEKNIMRAEAARGPEWHISALANSIERRVFTHPCLGFARRSATDRKAIGEYPRERGRKVTAKRIPSPI